MNQAARIRSLFKVNPIIVKEIRSRMRGPRAFITLTAILVLMGAMMYALLQLILASARYSNIMSAQVGQSLFSALMFLELFIISAITPAVTAGAISSEKEKQTYEMLMATPLSPTSILWGKLISAMSYVFLLLFAAVPLASLVFIFGGVAPADMVKALLVLLVIAVAYGVLGLFLSALFGRTGRATVAAFITVVILMIGPIFLAGLVGVLRSSEPPRWLLIPSPISALSAALASAMGTNGPGDLFFLLSGIFNMGVMPLSQTSIPRPLYHYTIPFYVVVSLVLYMLSTRLVQPTRRWRLRPKELLVGVSALVVVLGLIIGAYLLTAPRYEWAINPNAVPRPEFNEPAFPGPVPPVMGEREAEVIVAEPVDNTPTPALPPGEASEQALDTTDQAAIYAAIARQYYTVDHTFGDQPPNWSVLYLIAATDDTVGAPDAPKGEHVEIPIEVQEEASKQLQVLPAKIIWVAGRSEVPVDNNTGMVEGGQGAIITFGNIHSQADGTVQVSASLYFGSLGAAGKTYILTREDNTWVVIGTTGPEWIS